MVKDAADKLRGWFVVVLAVFFVGAEVVVINREIDFMEEERSFVADWHKHAHAMEAAENTRRLFFERWANAMENAECEASVIDAIRELPNPHEGHDHD